MPNASALEQAKELLVSGIPQTEADARALLQQDPEVFIFLFLELAMRVGQKEDLQRSPSTPSGMIPPYEKPSASSSPNKKGKKPGGQRGHPGASRPRPERIDRHEELLLPCCPDCGGALQRCNGYQSQRLRYIEDIPEKIEPQVTEYLLHRDYCPQCKKPVEPKVETALKNTRIGNRLLCLTAYWHYGVGMTISQILDTLNYHLQFPLSKGGLVGLWHQLRILLMLWYEILAEEIVQSAVVHGDETGWRVNGQTHWLWCFSSADTTYYMVDRSRGSPALLKFFREEFNGVLVTDFWAAYDVVSWMEHQCCLFHLLNELEKVNRKNTSEEWTFFSKKTQRLLRDAIALSACEDFTPERYGSRIQRLQQRLLEIAYASYKDADTRRLAKRLEKYQDELFVFLHHPEVPATNNQAEREIRPAVIMRKNMYGNRSEKGALTQSVLMTVFRTLKRRGYNPIDTLVSALAAYIRTGQLPPFPPKITSGD